MDINKHTNRKHKTTDISPYLRKAQLFQCIFVSNEKNQLRKGRD